MTLTPAPIPGWFASPYGAVPPFLRTDHEYGGEYLPLGNPIADELGFLTDHFSGWMWRFGHVIYVCNVESLQPGQGHFSALLNNLWGRGYTVRVPTPLLAMTAILRHKRFRRKQEWDRGLRMPVEVWERKP